MRILKNNILQLNKQKEVEVRRLSHQLVTGRDGHMAPSL